VKRVLVTGANKGIGLAIAAGVLESGDDSYVFVGSRSRERGRAALASLGARDASWRQRTELIVIDVTDGASVTAAAEHVATTCGKRPAPLCGIVNNAGIGFRDATMAEVLEVNTHGVRRVCEAFIPLLEPAGGRIVNVTSASGPNFVAGCSAERQRVLTSPQVTWRELEELMQECLAIDGDEQAFAAKGLGDGSSYGLSKACTNAYTLLLARQNPELIINACTPGFIETDLTRHYAESQGKSPSQLGMKSPQQGAVAPLHLLLGAVDGSGRYYGSDALRSPLDRYRAPGAPAYTGN
jgi:carbonyl reductase 1